MSLGMVVNGAIGVGGTIVKKLVAGTFGSFCGGGLVGREFTECCEKGGVNSTAIKKEGANDLL